jgi:uncharacterized membrane protein
MQLWFLIGILAGFATIVFFIINYLNTSVLCDVDCSIRNRVTAALIFSSLFAMFVGSFTYYFISEKYERKISRIHKDYTATFRFLPPDQRKVLYYLIKCRGICQQNELFKATQLSRVKISRIVKLLQQKEIISITENGMTNTIRLTKELKDVFVK